MVEAEALVGALLAAARGGRRRCSARPGSREAESGGGAASRVALEDGARRRCALVVAADGARSRLREAAGIGWVGWSYPQVGIVATVGPRAPP